MMAEAGKIGFRIFNNPPRPDAALIDHFRDFASPNIADAMGRFHFMDPEIQSRTGFKLCGVAVTVMTRPGDNLMVHKAIEIASPGDIIVVNTGGNTSNAVFGELMGRAAVAIEIGGLVVDGAIRDIEALIAIGFPAFSRTISAGGCHKDGPGEINVPVVCGNTVVMPGDIVVGDPGGVVVVPQGDAAEVLRLVNALKEREIRRILEIESGQVFNPDIDATLKAKGVIR
jgi:regulator of RNase E activity RraA